MGTKERRAREKANVREEILDAARALFVQHGFENVSVRKIADKIEYAPGTIYLYFKDKEEIFQTLCEQTFSGLHAKMSAIVADNANPLEKLRRTGRTYIEFAVQNPSQYTLTFLRRPDGIPTEAAGTACFQALCQIVQQCVESGLTRSKDVMEISQSVWACVHGLASLLIIKCDFPFVEHSRLIDSVVDLTIEGIRKR